MEDKNTDVFKKLGIKRDTEIKSSPSTAKEFMEEGSKVGSSPYVATPSFTGYGKLTKYDTDLLPGMDLHSNRARNQPLISKVGKTAANIVPNIAMSLVEYGGFAGELINYGLQEIQGEDYDVDFSNAITELANKGKDVFGETYQYNPDQVIDFRDPAWYLNQTSGLVESIGSFLLAGAGIGKLTLGAGRKLSGAIANNIAKGSVARGVTKGIDVGAQGLAAASLSYMEGALSGAEVFKQTRDYHYAQTGDWEAANLKASESAAQTAALSTALVTGLNMTSLYPIFKSTNLLKRAEMWGLNRQIGESTKEFAERMAKAKTNPSAPVANWYRKFGIPLEAGQESIEELANVFAERKGKISGGVEEFEGDNLKLFMDTMMSEEGMLSAVLGAIGGAGQQVGMMSLPLNRVNVAEEGQKPQIKYLSRRQMEDMEASKQGIPYAKTLERDMRDFLSAREELEKAMNEGSEMGVEIAKRKLFDVSSRRSIPLDGGEAIKSSIRELAAIDNSVDRLAEIDQQIQALNEREQTEEVAETIGKLEAQRDKIEQRASDLGADTSQGVSDAMMMGLTDSMQNNEYKKTAEDKISQVDQLRDFYEQTISTYNYGDERTLGLAEYVFDLRLRKTSAEESLEFINSKLSEIESEISKVEESILPEALQGDPAQGSAIFRLASKKAALDENLKEFKEELRKAKQGNKALSQKYKTQSIDDTVAAINRSIKETENQLEFIDNSLKDYAPELIQEAQMTSSMRNEYVDGLKAKDKTAKYLKELNRREAYVTSSEGRKDFITKAYNAYRSEKAKQEEVKESIDEQEAKKTEEAATEEAREKKKEKSSTKTKTEPTPSDIGKATGEFAGETDQEFTEEDQDIIDTKGETDPEITEEGETANATLESIDLIQLVDRLITEEIVRDEESFHPKAKSSHKIQYGFRQKYTEVETPEGTIEKVTSGNELIDIREPRLNSIENSMIGETIVISVDEEYDGKVYDESDKETDQVPTDVYNKPMKIETEDGKLIGYLPTLRWISRQKGGEYVNIASFKSESGINNAAVQIKLLKKLREKIDKGARTTTITGMTRGVPIYNRTKDGKKHMDKASKLLPDPDIEFGIARASEVSFSEDSFELTTIKDGTVFALLGGFPVPMWIDNITIDDYQVITQAIIAKATNDEAKIEEIDNVIKDLDYGFDFKASSGLADLISERVYTSRFTKEDLDNAKNPLKIFFHVDPTSGYAHLSRANIGLIFTTNPELAQQEGYAPLVTEEGTIDEGAKDLLDSLNTNLNIDKLNTEDSYQEVVIKDGKFDTTTYQNYNEYAKTRLSTYNDGRNTLNHGTEENPDIEYLYWQQQVVTFDHKAILQEEAESVEETPVEESEEITQESEVESTEETEVDNEFYVPEIERGSKGEVRNIEGINFEWNSPRGEWILSEDIFDAIKKKLGTSPSVKRRASIARSIQGSPITLKQFYVYLEDSRKDLQKESEKEVKPKFGSEFYVPKSERKTIDDIGKKSSPNMKSDDDKLEFPAQSSGTESLKSDIGEFLEKYTIEGFTDTQIDEVTDSIVFFIASEFLNQDELPTVEAALNEAFEIFRGEFSKSMDDGDGETAFHVSKVLRNWSSFAERAIDSLRSIGFEAKEVIEGEGSNYERTKYDAKARWYQNSKDTASANLKLFMSQIPLQKYEGDTRITVTSDWLGERFKRFVPLDEIYDKTMAVLVDQEPNFSNFMNILEAKGMEYPPFMTLKEALEDAGDSSTLKEEFVKVMSKHYIDLQVALLSPVYNKDGDLTGYNFKPISSDRNSAIDMIISDWVESMKSSDLVKEVEGNLILDADKFNKIKIDFIEKMDGKTPSKNKKEIRTLLESLGIELSEATWEVALTNNTYAFGKKGLSRNFKVVNGKPRKNTFLDILFDHFPDSDTTSFEEDNPIAGEGLKSKLRKLASYEFNNSDKIYTSSFNDIEGNIIYPYQMNTLYSESIRRMRDPFYAAELRNLSFSKYSRWLSEPDEVTLHYIDGIKNQKTTKGTTADQLGKPDTDLLAAIMYFGTVNQTRGKKGMFQTTAKSDKTTYPVIKAPRVDISVSMENDFPTEFRGETKKAIRNVMKAEFDRVNNYVSTYKAQLDAQDITFKGYHEYDSKGNFIGGADKFILFPELNKEIAEEYIEKGVITRQEFNRVWKGEYPHIIKSNEEFGSSYDIMYKVVEARLLEESRELYQDWEDFGLIFEDTKEWPNADGTTETVKTVGSILDQGYMRLKDGAGKYSKTSQKASYAVTDFTVNHFLSMAEEFMVVSGDPAQFWKPTKNGDLKADIKSTIENINKRLARDIAPRSDGFYEKPTFTMVSAIDPEVASRYLEELGEGFSFLEIADAQEYTTVEEHLRVLRAEGKISKAKYNELTDVIKPGKYYEFSEEQLETLMSPVKPLYTGNKIMSQYDVNLTNYVKSSSFPLLPQFTNGFELDKVRIAMEDPKTGVDRLSFNTANKLGAKNSVQIFDGRKVVDNLDFSKSRKILDRRGFGLQQEDPVKDKDVIGVVTQANKLLFNTIRNVEGFSFEGENYTGRELEIVKENIRKALLFKAQDQLYRDIGAVINSDGEMQFESLEKVKDILKREAIDRNWSIAAVEGLQLTEDGKSFKIPPALSTNANSIESLILSLISKIVTDQEIHGYSYIQGSSAGIQSYKDFRKKNIGFAPTKQFEEKGKGLSFITRGKDKTEFADVIVPWRYKDNAGNDLNINDFTDENGVIIDEKLPPEARNLIGMRIPNQGHNSMLPMRIVGYLPKGYGSLAIVPEEIVAQMGSDFDVDKLYTYQPKLIYDNESESLSRDNKKISDYTSVVSPQEYFISSTEEDFFLEERNRKFPLITIRNLDNSLQKNRLVRKPESSTSLYSLGLLTEKGANSRSDNVTYQSAIYKANNPSKALDTVIAFLNDKGIDTITYDFEEYVRDKKFVEELKDRLKRGESFPKRDIRSLLEEDISEDLRATIGNIVNEIEQNLINKLGVSESLIEVVPLLNISYRDKLELDLNLTNLGYLFDKSFGDLLYTDLEGNTYSVQSSDIISYESEFGPIEYIDKEGELIMINPSKENYGQNPKEFSFHSGGARGSDTIWGEIAQESGIENINHYYVKGNNTPKGNKVITLEEAKEADIKLKKANQTLKRTFPTKNEYVNNLLRRNWQQVSNSDAVYAVSELSMDKVTVKGGTGWAVQMAIDEGKPVFVFDQSENSWYKWISDQTNLFGESLQGKFVLTETPTLSKKFAGIGTRDINSLGKEAIKNAFRKTFNPESLKVPEKEFKERKNIRKDDLLNVDSNNPYSRVPKDILTNKYIEIFESVLSHPEMFDKIKSPLDKEDLIIERDSIVSKIEDESKIYSPASYIGQRDYKLNQKSAGRLIGIFALANTLNSIIQDRKKANLTIQRIEDNEAVPDSIEVKIGNKNVSLVTLSGEGTSTYDGEQRTKGDNISLLLTAAVDNANLNVLGQINLNVITAGPAVTLTLLESEDGQALDLGYIAKFVSQPVIRDLVSEIETMKSITNEEVTFNMTDNAIKSVLQRYKDNLEKNSKTDYVLSEDDLNNNLGVSIDSMTETQLGQQVAVLEMFKKLNTISDDVRDLQQTVLSPTTNGIDNRVPVALQQITNAANLITSGLSTITNVNDLMKNVQGNTSEQAAVMDTVYNNAKRIISSLLPEYTRYYYSVVNDIQEITNKDLTNQQLLTVWKGVKEYLNSSSDITGLEDVDSVRERLLFGTEEEADLATRIDKAKNTWGKDFYFLKRLAVTKSTKPGIEPSTVEFRADKSQRLDDSKNTTSLASMFISENRQANKVAMDLVLYNLANGGVQGPVQFAKYIPPAILEYLKIPEAFSKEINSQIAAVQVLQHNPTLAPIIAIDDSIVSKISRGKGGIHKVVLKNPESNRNNPIVEDNSYPDYLSVYDPAISRFKLLRQSSVAENGTVIYDATTTLGINQISEYKQGSVIESSILLDRDKETNQRRSVPLPNKQPHRNAPNKVNVAEDLGVFADMLPESVIEHILETGTVENSSDLYNNIDFSDPEFEIFKIVDSYVENSPSIRFVSSTNSRPAEFDRKNNQITLYAKEITSDNINEVLLHELVHSATHKAIDNNTAPEVKSLTTLMNRVKRESEGLSELEEQQLSNLHEFVAATLTSKSFQKKLNEVPFNNKNALERFVELIKNLISTIAESVGITVNQNSALESAISDIVTLMESPTMNKPVDDVEPDVDPGLVGRDPDSDFMLGFPKSSNFSIDPAVQRMVDKMNERISSVGKKVSSAKKDSQREQQLKTTLNRLKEERSKLLEDSAGDSIVEVAKEQASWVKAVANNKTSSDTQLEIASDIIASWKWENTENLLTRNQRRGEGKIRQAFLEADTIIKRAETDLRNARLRRARDLINKDLPEDQQVMARDLQFMEDAGIGTQWLFDASQIDNQLAQYLFQLIFTQSNRANDEFIEFEEKLNEKAKLVDDWDKFKQLDEEGNWTSNFIHEYSHKYEVELSNAKSNFYSKLNKAEDKKEDNKKKRIRSAVKEYNRKMNKLQETVDLRMLLLEGYKSPLWNSRKEYIDYLESTYGEQRSQHMIEQAKAQYEQYKEDKRNQKQSFEEEYHLIETELSQQAWVQNKMDTWILEHDPMITLDEKFGTVDREIKQYTAYKGNDYLVSVPRMFDSRGNKTGFYDENFESLTEEEKEFYEFYVNSIHRFMGNLPRSYTRKLPNSFFPRVKYNLMEALQREGVKGSLRYMNSSIVDSITAGEISQLEEQDQRNYQEIDPRTGEPRKEIPVKYINQNEDPDSLSFNVPNVMRMFAGMSIKYKWMSSIEDTSNLLLQVVRDAEKIQTKGKSPLKDSEGKYVTSKNGVMKMTESLEYLVEAGIYGKRVQEYNESNIPIFDSWNVVENSRKRTRMKEIRNERDELEEKFENREISKEDYELEMDELIREYESLGGKNLVWGKVFEKALHYRQMTGMGWNLTAGIANFGFGALSNYTWAASGRDFTGGDLTKAYRLVLTSITSKNPKIANIVKKWDILFEVTEMEYGKSSDKSKLNNKFTRGMNPYWIQRTTEYGVQAPSAVAQLLHKKIEVTNKKTGEKETVSLFEALNDNAEWKEEYILPEEWTSKKRPEDPINELDKFKAKIIQANKYMHGNYDPKSPWLAKKYILGKMLFMFRSWIPYGFKQRIGSEQYDRMLGRTFKGRYRTLYDIGLKKSLRGIFGSLVRAEEFAYGKKGSKDRLSDVDIDNIKMNLREMQMLVGFMLIGVMAKASLDDDDDDSLGSRTAHILINQLYRVEQDIYFYLNPRTFEDILRNPIPLMQSYREFENAIFGSMSYITDSDYEGSELAKDWGRTLPLANQILKTDYLSTNLH